MDHPEKNNAFYFNIFVVHILDYLLRKNLNKLTLVLALSQLIKGKTI